MPISVALPAPSVEWESELYGLAATNNPASTPAANISSATGARGMRPSWSSDHLLDSNQTAARSYVGWGGRGGSVATTWFQRNGRPCYRQTNTAANNQGEGISMPTAPIYYGRSADIAPGALHPPNGVVWVVDFHVAVTLFGGVVPLWPNNKCGFFFLPLGNVNGFDIDTFMPTGATPAGGFAMFLNNVAGAARWQYTAWAQGTGAILEQVTVPLAQVPNVTDWSSFRFIIVSATSSHEARLTVQANGVDVLSNREFGSAFLQRPSVAAAGVASGANGFVFCVGQQGSGVNSDTLFYNFDSRCGRFTPDGQEQQGE